MSNNNPRVSIGLPVYNGERFLREALDSILAQTFEDFELIISDNASTDTTEEICRTYESQDQRIYYHRHNQNRGAAWNFNYIVPLARGEYFKWAADDDVCAPSFLACCVAILDHDSTVVLSYPRTTFTKADGQRWWEGKSTPQLDSEKPHERFEAVIGNVWCLEVFGLMRKQALEQTALIAPYYGSDRLLLAQLSLKGRFREIPEPLFFRRCHSNQSSRLSAKERVTWIAPQTTQRFKFLQNRGSVRYLQAIFQAQLNWDERLHCLAVIRRYLTSSNTWNKFFFKKAPTKV